MCASLSEKPLCFSCLSVCIVVQGKRHTQFLLCRFSIWRCPLYFYWLVYGWPLHTLYERGILRLYIWKTLGNLRTAWVHAVLVYHFLSSDRRAVCWSFPASTLVRMYTARPSIPQRSVATSWTGDLSHRYGSNFLCFLHFVVWKVFFFISLTRVE